MPARQELAPPHETPRILTGIYLPTHVAPNNQGAFEKVGVRTRTVASEHETTLFMATQAAMPLARSLSASDVAVVGVTTSFPIGEHLSGEIANTFGFENADVLDVYAACSGFPRLLRALKENEERLSLDGKTIITIASERYSPYLLAGTWDDSIF